MVSSKTLFVEVKEHPLQLSIHTSKRSFILFSFVFITKLIYLKHKKNSTTTFYRNSLENDEARRKHKIPTQLRFYSLTSYVLT